MITITLGRSLSADSRIASAVEVDAASRVLAAQYFMKLRRLILTALPSNAKLSFVICSSAIFAALDQKPSMQGLDRFRMRLCDVVLLLRIILEIEELPGGDVPWFLIAVLDDLPLAVAQRPAIRPLVPDPVQISLLQRSIGKEDT